LFRASFLQKFEQIFKFNIGGDFPMKKVQKLMVFCIFLNKYSTYLQKRSLEVLHTKYTTYVKIWVYFKIKPGRR
jgi:hypothetical protein